MARTQAKGQAKLAAPKAWTAPGEPAQAGAEYDLATLLGDAETGRAIVERAKGEGALERRAAWAVSRRDPSEGKAGEWRRGALEEMEDIAREGRRPWMSREECLSVPVRPKDLSPTDRDVVETAWALKGMKSRLKRGTRLKLTLADDQSEVAPLARAEMDAQWTEVSGEELARKDMAKQVRASEETRERANDPRSFAGKVLDAATTGGFLGGVVGVAVGGATLLSPQTGPVTAAAFAEVGTACAIIAGGGAALGGVWTTGVAIKDRVRGAMREVRTRAGAGALEALAAKEAARGRGASAVREAGATPPRRGGIAAFAATYQPPGVRREAQRDDARARQDAGEHARGVARRIQANEARGGNERG